MPHQASDNYSHTKMSYSLDKVAASMSRQYEQGGHKPLNTVLSWEQVRLEHSEACSVTVSTC